jgi:hypothetical protein
MMIPDSVTGIPLLSAYVKKEQTHCKSDYTIYMLIFQNICKINHDRIITLSP